MAIQITDITNQYQSLIFLGTSLIINDMKNELIIVEKEIRWIKFHECQQLMKIDLLMI